MAKARSEIELTVRLDSTPGSMGRALSILADHAINILAYCAYSERQQGVLLIVVDNPHRAKVLLQDAGYECRASSVVLVGATDQVGGAALLGARLGFAGVNILYSYASSAGASQFYAVFKTNDDVRALQILGAKDVSTQAA